jgi:hypothetical protein
MIIQKDDSNFQTRRHFRQGTLWNVTAFGVSEWATFSPLVDDQLLATFASARAILL